MPGEMCAFLNKLFTLRHYKMKRRSYREKIIGLLFFCFDNCGPFEGGTGHMSPTPFFLIQPCCNLQDIFSNQILYVELNKMCFGNLNLCYHLLIGIRYEKDITYNEMQKKLA